MLRQFQLLKMEHLQLLRSFQALKQEHEFASTSLATLSNAWKQV